MSENVAGGVDDLVEGEVEVAEVEAHDVPVGLLALHVQVDQVDAELLQVAGEALGGGERGLGDVGVGLDDLRHGGHASRFS